VGGRAITGSNLSEEKPVAESVREEMGGVFMTS